MSSRRWHRVWVPLALVFLIFLSGCAKGTSPSAPTPSSPPAPEVPAAAAAPLRIVLQEEPNNLEPGYVGVNELRVSRNIVEALVNRDPQTGEIVPELALSWQQVNDTTWRFMLRQGVQYQNGEPFNAEAAAYGINRAADPNNNMHVLSFLVPMQARAVDEYTLDITTEQPDPVLLKRIWWVALPAPKATQSSAEKELRSPVGTGPYKLVKWTSGEGITLEANPNYWGDKPAVPSVEYVWRTESTVRAAMIRTNEAQIAVNIAPQDAGQVKMLTVVIPETPFLRMDVPSPPLTDLRVRQAINYAIDRQAIAKAIFGGYATPATQLITPDVTGHNPAINPWPHDPQKARDLVQAARADGVPVDLPITIYGTRGMYANSAESLEAMSAMLNDAGLNTKVQILEVNAFVQLRGQQPIPTDRRGLIQGSHGNEMGDASFTVPAYYRSDGSHSPARDPKVDQMESAARVLTGEDRATAYREIMAYLHDNVVSDVALVHMQALYAVTENVQWQPRPDNLLLLKEISLKK